MELGVFSNHQGEFKLVLQDKRILLLWWTGAAWDVVDSYDGNGLTQRLTQDLEMDEPEIGWDGYEHREIEQELADARRGEE